jgi:hypothetical protein
MHHGIYELLQYFSFAVVLVIIVRQMFTRLFRVVIPVEMELFFATVNSLLVVLPKSLYLTFMELSFLEPISDGLGWVAYSLLVTFLIWAALSLVIRTDSINTQKAPFL